VTRFYARLVPLELECPACGRIIVQELMTGIRKRKKGKGQKWEYLKHPAYNPVTGRLSCPYCGRTFALGVLAWETQKGGGDRPSDVRLRPADQYPTDAQKREIRRVQAGMREETGGYTTDTGVRWGDPLNEVRPPCTCPQQKDGQRIRGAWSPACPIHGDPQQQGGEA
jgi:hypothetical protein